MYTPPLTEKKGEENGRKVMVGKGNRREKRNEGAEEG